MKVWQILYRNKEGYPFQQQGLAFYLESEAWDQAKFLNELHEGEFSHIVASLEIIGTRPEEM